MAHVELEQWAEDKACAFLINASGGTWRENVIFLAQTWSAARARGIAEVMERAAKIAGRIVAAFKQYGDEDEIGAAESVLDAIRSKAAKIGDSNDQS